MYKTILVPVDISEDELTSKAVKHALSLAKKQVRGSIFFMYCQFHQQSLMHIRWDMMKLRIKRQLKPKMI